MATASPCADCARLLKQREAVGKQVAALSKENEALARQVEELTRELEEARADRSSQKRRASNQCAEGPPLAASGDVLEEEGEEGCSDVPHPLSHITPEMIMQAASSFPFDLSAGRTPLMNADKKEAQDEAGAATLAPPSLPSASTMESVADWIPDLFTDGDDCYPEQIVADFQPAASTTSKPLAACLVATPDCDNIVIAVSTLDKSISLFGVPSVSEAQRASHLPTRLPRLLASSGSLLPSPALSLSFLGEVATDKACSGGSSSILAAGHMDGSVSLWEIATHSSSSVYESAQSLQVSLRPALTVETDGESSRVTTAGHSKFVTRIIALSHPSTSSDGKASRLLFATSSTDGTLAVWQASKQDDCFFLRRLQFLSFPGGAITAMTWAAGFVEASLLSTRPSPAHGSATTSAVGTLVVAVASSPYLFYLSLVSSSMNGESLPQVVLLLQRIPISADGMKVSLKEGTRKTDDGGDELAAPTVHYSPPLDLSPPTVVPLHHPTDATSMPAFAADSAVVGLSPSLAGALAGSVVDVIPVGFSIVDLQAAPVMSAASGAHSRQPVWLLAAATSTGLVSVYRFGSSELLRSLAGHMKSVTPTFSSVGGLSSASSVGGAASLSAPSSSTKISWFPPPSVGRPQFILATTDAGDTVVALGLASFRPIKTIARGSDASGPRTTLRVMETMVLSSSPPYSSSPSAISGGSNGPRLLLLTLDNSGHVCLRLDSMSVDSRTKANDSGKRAPLPSRPP